jgi:N-acetylglucosamine-6-phosphate deacetylase
VRTADGTLAGSDLALDQAVRNLVTFTGCTAAEAVATVTTTPARLLGLDDRGALEAGRRADVVVLDATLHVVATFVSGELAHLVADEAWRWKS